MNDLPRIASPDTRRGAVHPPRYAEPRSVGLATDELGLVENLRRADLHPLEIAKALQALRHKHGWTQERLAANVGRSLQWVNELLTLNELPARIREEVPRFPQWSASTLVELQRVRDEQRKLALWDELKLLGASVKALRNLRRSDRSTCKPAPPPDRPSVPPGVGGALDPVFEAVALLRTTTLERGSAIRALETIRDAAALAISALDAPPRPVDER